ncbi:MAG: hypothetical protein A2020_14965 [Lentisphaerae bacterium GWF2_45_14]|nr:MAG: hypothetical protein A2020_14965 [Lentisphaerae bacterium GWF2_45_14]
MENISDLASKITVLGIGSSGVKIAERLFHMPEMLGLEIIGMDTDANSLGKSSLANKTAIDSEWRGGYGCGGDVIKGQRSFSRERARIRSIIESASLLIVTGGLGGGTVTGGAPIIASEARACKKPVIFVLSIPFVFEGYNKNKLAEDGIKELLPMADILICVPNDLLFSSLSADAPVEEAFRKADEEISRAILGISELVRCGNLLSTDFSDLRSVLARRKSTCGVGVGLASDYDGLNRCHMALERVLSSPLLGGPGKIKNAHALFISVTGGSDLQIGEVKKALESVQSLARKNARMIIGANTDDAYNGKIQITLITVNFEDVASDDVEEFVSEKTFVQESAITASSSSAPEPPLSSEYEQQELPLLQISRGIFLNSSPSMYDGLDLDIPTFQRLNLVVDKGD